MPRFVVAIAVVVAGGCGRVGFEPVPVATDAAPDALGAFGTPEVIGMLSDPSDEDDPTLPDDMREIYFESGRSGQADIWRSTRSSVDAPWSPPALVTELSSTSTDDHPAISRDGHEIYFTSTRGGSRDIWHSTRADRDTPWAVPVVVTELSDMSIEDAEPDMDASATRIALGRGAVFARELFEATRASPDATWSAPTRIVELNTGEHQSSPFYASERELWFGSIRPGSERVDIYRAVRASVDDPFGEPERIENINSAADDDDMWLSPDGRTLIFSSTRSGDSELYVVTR